jgi:hypothetical protein
MNEAARRLGISLPIVQAPVGSMTTAGPRRGGFPMRRTRDARGHLVQRRTSCASGCARLARSLRKPIGVNLVLAFDVRRHLEVALEEGVRIISFLLGRSNAVDFVGSRREWSRRAFRRSVHEATLAVQAGVDVLVAQGAEAGGHVRGTRPRDLLMTEVKGIATGLPVLAAGGVADARDVREALRAGADGVWPGTRFVASDEAAAHRDYKRLIVESSAADTLLCDLSDIGWPEAPIACSEFNRFEPGRPPDARPMAPGPEKVDIVAHFPDGTPIIRYEDAPPIEGTTGDIESLFPLRRRISGPDRGSPAGRGHRAAPERRPWRVTSRPLDGIRIVTIAINLPGPAAARRLVGLGALVTKVEPPSGDPMAAYHAEWYAAMSASQDVQRIDLKDGRGTGGAWRAAPVG